MKLPNFLVIGAPKSGTTSLFYYLRQHPDIYLPVKKELHYFSYQQIAENSKGPGDLITLDSLCDSKQKYQNHYAKANKESAIGEFSPSYLYYANVGEQIKKILDPVKIIVMLRNPIEKAYSQYMHLVRDQRETLNFYDALMAEPERKKNKWGDIWLYASSSLYTDKLKIYQSIFGSNNVKVVLFKNFINNPDDTLIDIFTFLGVDPTIKCDTKTIYNRSGTSRSKLVANFFSNPNVLKTFIKNIFPETLRIPLRLFLLNLNTGKKDNIDAKSETYLADYFREDIVKLELLLNKKTGWLG
ncbi:MAG: sulfotransferase [Proteobacteria bacterium]|nr:sulfotransferase [Pseudomonadota bacterium]MBU1388038.1 sulfotransferase [Pseudomonadota bacterium]MBU1542101.1 sulfotransferase [Pseudomonadota bacterium]